MIDVRRLVLDYAGAWRAGSGRDRLLLAAWAAIAALLTGAFLFGAWHVLMGWLIKGNPRAGAFGVALAAVTGAGLAVSAVVGRRILPSRADARQVR
jgi:hypothetical protein